MIEQILYINLDSRPDRNEEFCRVMESLNGAIPIMTRFSAHDGRNYDSRNAVIDAAVADGFEFFKQYRLPKYLWGGRGSLAYIWSYVTCLRRCVTSEQTTLILFDDRPLGQSISEVNKVLQTIAKRASDPFRVLQLNWFNPFNLEQHVSEKPTLPYLKDYCFGFSGHGDQRNIYSPDGAQWLLDAIAVYPLGLEELTGFYSMSPYSLSGIYSYCHQHPNPWVTYIDIEDDVQDRIEIDSEDKKIDEVPKLRGKNRETQRISW